MGIQDKYYNEEDLLLEQVNHQDIVDNYFVSEPKEKFSFDESEELDACYVGEMILSTSMEKVIEQHPSDNAMMIIDTQDYARKMNIWKELFPKVTPFYAVKCNPNPEIVSRLAALGAHFDCASPQEIELVQKIIAKTPVIPRSESIPSVSSQENLLEEIEAYLHRSPSISSLSSFSSVSTPENGEKTELERIIYANPCKTNRAIKYAKDHGVSWLVVDSAEEVEKIAVTYPQAKLFIRIKVDDSASLCQFSSKFGISPQGDDIERLLQTIKDRQMYLEGISFHVGSGCSDAILYKYALADVLSVYHMAAKKYDIHTIKTVDIGGGFMGEEPKLLAEIAKNVAGAIKNFPSHVSFISEPGRFFVSQSQTLITRIGSKKFVDGVMRYYVNDGVYCSFNNILHDHYNPKFGIMGSTSSSKMYKTSIFGPTCDSIDKMVDQKKLPEFSVDDYLVFQNMGAYTNAAGTTFNGFDQPTLYYI